MNFKLTHNATPIHTSSFKPNGTSFQSATYFVLTPINFCIIMLIKKSVGVQIKMFKDLYEFSPNILS